MKSVLSGIFFQAIFWVLAGSAFAQKKAEAPTNTELERPLLVVGIVVDQMRYDFLYRYWNAYGNGGFKRLLRQGYSFANCTYNYFPTKTAAGHASIYTGTTPALHGVVGNDWYEPALGRNMHCVQDDSVTAIGGNAENGKKSPRNMKTLSICDQLKLATNFKGKTFGVSLKDRGAILPAGHGADAAFWFDPETGNFISSSFYPKLQGKLPGWLDAFNARKRATYYRNQTWEPLLPPEKYGQSATDNNEYENGYFNGKPPVFPYKLSTYHTPNFEIVKRSPFGNSILTEIAQALVAGENLGGDGETDMLTISYSSTDEVGHSYGPFAIETQDTYLRLDKDLAALFTFLDGRVGEDKYLVFLTADHGILEIPAFLQDHNLPSGHFSNSQFVSNLKAFSLQAFDSVQLVKAYINQQLFLDHNLMRTRGLQKERVFSDFIAFIEKQPNVLRSFAFSGSRPFPEPPLLAKYEAGYFPGRSGDIQVVMLPGILEGSNKKGTNHTAPYSYDSHVPCLWMGWKIAPGENSTPVSITDIAPTLASLLHILEPNGSTGKAQSIPLKKQKP